MRRLAFTRHFPFFALCGREYHPCADPEHNFFFGIIWFPAAGTATAGPVTLRPVQYTVARASPSARAIPRHAMAVRVDHTVEAEVEALVTGIVKEHAAWRGFGEARSLG